MGYKLGYHILVLLNQVLFINGVITNEILLLKKNSLKRVCLKSGPLHVHTLCGTSSRMQDSALVVRRGV